MRLIRLLLCAIALVIAASAEERSVDPTWLHRYVPRLAETATEITTTTCHYKAVFGAGDPQASVLRGVARFGQAVVDAGGSCAAAAYPREEQLLVVLEGEGALYYAGEPASLRRNDFLYVPPGVKYRVANSTNQPLRVLIMGYRIPEGAQLKMPPGLLKANIDEVEKQTVAGHPPTVLYQLLVGDTSSTRDRIAAGHVVTSLFLMSFAPGGTNFPHHHETEEEIYLVLEGKGQIVAGGGMDGVEGKHAAGPGDAYFFRLNATVGFYGSPEPGSHARILAVRSRFPFK